MVFASDSQSGGPGFESRYDNWLAFWIAGFVLGRPEFKSSATLVNLNPLMLYLDYSFSKYFLIVKRFGSLREWRYIIIIIIIIIITDVWDL